MKCYYPLKQFLLQPRLLKLTSVFRFSPVNAVDGRAGVECYGRWCQGMHSRDYVRLGSAGGGRAGGGSH